MKEKTENEVIKSKKRRTKTIEELDQEMNKIRELKRKKLAAEKQKRDRERTGRLIAKGAFIEAIFGEMTLDETRKYILEMRNIAIKNGGNRFRNDVLFEKEKLINSGSVEIKGRQLDELKEIIYLSKKGVNEDV